jgi:hypothetical protein
MQELHLGITSGIGGYHAAISTPGVPMCTLEHRSKSVKIDHGVDMVTGTGDQRA